MDINEIRQKFGNSTQEESTTNTAKTELIYKSDIEIKRIRTTIGVILSYIFLIFLWGYTVSLQTTYYHLMNISVFLMLVLGTVAMKVCAEESENIIKYTKNQIYMYLIITFVYDLFLKALAGSLFNYSQHSLDAEVGIRFLIVISSILKIGFPIAFIVWFIQKMFVYGNNKTKRKTMEELRNIRNTKV